MIDLALSALAQGWHIFPLIGKKPAIPGAGGFKNATNDPAKWAAMLQAHPQTTGYGIATGLSGLVVLDVDMGPGKVGGASFEALEQAHPFGETLVVRTGGGGYHFYFSAVEGRPTKCSNSRVGKHVDIKAVGGYVVGPGSLHPSGSTYEIATQAQVIECPDWLLSLNDSKPTKLGSGRSEHTLGVALDKPSDSELGAALKRWRKLSRRKESAGVAWAALRAVMRGDAYAAPGVIHDTTRDLAYWMASDFRGLDHKWFADVVLEKGWLRMEWPNDQKTGQVGVYDGDRIRAVWDRCWQTGLDKHAQEAQARGAQATALAESTITDAFGGGRTEPYTDIEISLFASECGVSVPHFTRRWVIQAGTSFYIWFVGGYVGPFKQQEFLSACAKYLAPAEGRTKLLAFSPQGDVSRRPVDQILSDYATHAAQVAYDLGASQSYYDAPAHTIVEATCPLRTSELGGALEDPEVASWLADMSGGGETLERLLDWLSVAPVLDLAAPAIWFLGGAGTGKSLFVKGVAQLWDSGGRASELGDAMGRFNSDLLRCPLVFGDEAIPKDHRGKPLVDELKRFISAESHRIERKGLDLNETKGAARVVIAANNENMLALQADLTREDITALGDRIIMVEVPESCPKMPKEKAQDWLRTGAIARHTLWLAETRSAGVRADRFACASTGATVERKLLAHSSIHGAILEHVTLELLDGVGADGAPIKGGTGGGVGGPVFGGKAPEPAVRVSPSGDILVCAQLLRGEVPRHGVFTKDRIGTKVLADACRALVGRAVVRPSPENSSNSRRRYKVLDTHTYLAWLEDSDFDTGSILDALEAKTKKARAADKRVAPVKSLN